MNGTIESNLNKNISKVSVVIPTFNRCSDLDICLESLLLSTYPLHQVIVVDNNSSDETKKIAEKYSKYSWFKYIYSDKNLWASGGRILGTKYCTGDYILYVDDDNKIAPDMIELLVKSFLSHKDAGLVAPVSLYSDRQDTVSYIGGEVNLVTSRFIEHYSKININEIDYSKTYITKAAMQNSFMISRDALEKTGGFDPIYKIMFDESDLGMKIDRAGFMQYVEPLAKTIHVGGKLKVDSNELRHLGLGSSERAFLFARNRNIFMRRYAPLYGKIIYFLCFMHLITFFYLCKAVKNKRLDIANQYLNGVINGIFYHI